MPTVFAATFVEKLASNWHPDRGADTRSRCIIAERINVTADSLPGLLAKLGDKFFLTIDDVFLPIDDDDEGITSIGYNRIEGIDCNPVDDDRAAAKRGELLYLCDYTFGVEKRTVAPLSIEDFRSADVTTH